MDGILILIIKVLIHTVLLNHKDLGSRFLYLVGLIGAELIKVLYY